jgi:excisionase family DNA binding protein
MNDEELARAVRKVLGLPGDAPPPMSKMTADGHERALRKATEAWQAVTGGLPRPDALEAAVFAYVAANPSAPVPSLWLTVGEAAEYLRCKPKRIYDLVSQKRLPGHKDGSRLLLRRDELFAYMDRS